ncbi:MAG: hydroxyacid dehydrogenase [Flavobacteriaceae bacterium]|nr:hydroxyacid dehydrogenase [Flavobacteriaceae bacterium]MCY4217441.1 hydroxyacid dehydrogenase [Flavobacteriaceae bacterium]MCY4254245.1 hydroxyacid dehydrogenase [Flavobacteriaceae bacterium]
MKSKPKVLHLEKNHPSLVEELSNLGFENILSYDSDINEIQILVADVQGIIIRSRLPLNEKILDYAKNLKFIARVGSGLENIHLTDKLKNKIHLVAAPEGNCQSVGEHVCGMILSLLHKLHSANDSVKNHQWLREEHRGTEIGSKTIGIIGYGHTGKATAKKLSGFDCKVIYCDLLPNLGDPFAQEVTLNEIFLQADIISLHVTENPSSFHLINTQFIQQMNKAFWLINTSRGSVVKTSDLVEGLKSGKILGAGLDVLEYESKGFKDVFTQHELSNDLRYLMTSENVLFSPHVAGWTKESHYLLAQTIIKKIKKLYT